MGAYAKAAVAVLAAAATVLVAALDGGVSPEEWVQVAIAGTTAVIVWLTANVPGAGAAKAAAAAVLAVLQVISASIGDGISSAEWAGIALAVVGALGVYLVPNRPAVAAGPAAAV